MDLMEEDNSWLRAKGPERIRTTMSRGAGQKRDYQSLDALYNNHEQSRHASLGRMRVDGDGYAADPGRAPSYPGAAHSTGATELQDLLRLTQKDTSPMHPGAYGAAAFGPSGGEANSPTNMLLGLLGLHSADTPHRNNSLELHSAFKSLPGTPVAGLSGAFNTDSDHLQHLHDILHGTTSRLHHSSHGPPPQGDPMLERNVKQSRALDHLISQIDDHTSDHGLGPKRHHADHGHHLGNGLTHGHGQGQGHGHGHGHNHGHAHLLGHAQAQGHGHSNGHNYGSPWRPHAEPNNHHNNSNNNAHPHARANVHVQRTNASQAGNYKNNDRILLDLFKDASPTATSLSTSPLIPARVAQPMSISRDARDRASPNPLGPSGGGIAKSAAGRPIRAAANRNTLIRRSPLDSAAVQAVAEWPQQTRQSLEDLVNKFDPKSPVDWQLIAAALGKPGEAELVERAYRDITSVNEASHESNTSGSAGAAAKPAVRSATTNKHGRRLNSRKGIPMHIMATYALMRLPLHEGNLSDMSNKIEANAFFCKQLDWTPRPGTKTYPRWKDALVGCFKPGRYPHLKKTMRKKEGLTVYQLVEGHIPEKSILKPSMVADVDPSQLPDDFDINNPLMPLRNGSPSMSDKGGQSVAGNDIARIITTGSNAERNNLAAAANAISSLQGHGNGVEGPQLAPVDELDLGGGSNSMRALVPHLDGAPSLLPNLSSLMPSLSLQKHMSDVNALRPTASQG